MAAVVNISVIYIFTDIVGLWYLYSAVISFIAAVSVSFTLQKLWTFKDLRLARVVLGFQGPLYLVFALINLGLNILLLYIFVDVFQWWYILGQIVAGISIAIVSFFVYRKIIFRGGV